MPDDEQGTQRAIGGLQTAVEILTTSVRDLGVKFDRYDEKQEARMLECQKFQRDEISKVKTVAYNPPLSVKTKLTMIGYGGGAGFLPRLIEILIAKIGGS